MFNPLEQFETVIYTPMNFFGFFDITFTQFSQTLLLLFVILNTFFILAIGEWRMFLPAYNWQTLTEVMYKFLYNVLKQQAGHKSEGYFPIVFVLFVFIILSNLFGLLPTAITVTAQFILTLTLAFSLNFGLIIIGFIEHGIYFLKKFLPSGTPLWLKPGLCVIEVISYLIRTISLSVRLFANMLAGHALMHIIESAFVGLVNMIGHVAILLSTVVILAVLVLEFGIAFLQAYVFIVLFCIYLSESLELDH